MTQEPKGQNAIPNPSVDKNEKYPIPRTEEEVLTATDKLWEKFSISDFSLEYRERALGMMKRATLVYLTTLDNLEELRNQMKTESYDREEKLLSFCKSLAPTSLHETTGTMDRVAYKIANAIELTTEEMTYKEKLLESVARSHLKTDKTDPYKNAWNKEEIQKDDIK